MLWKKSKGNRGDAMKKYLKQVMVIEGTNLEKAQAQINAFLALDRILSPDVHYKSEWKSRDGNQRYSFFVIYTMKNPEWKGSDEVAAGFSDEYAEEAAFARYKKGRGAV